MRSIYISIALLVLYGDLVKRYLLQTASGWILYTLAIVILFAIFNVNKKYRIHVPLSKEGKGVSLLAIFLSMTYLLQVLTSFDSSFMDALTHAAYVCIPLIYILVIQKRCPQFDLLRLGNIYLLLIIPVNCVGFIQYFIDPQFLISPVYGIEDAIIPRNFLFGGAFARFPSIYASADRYSAMGLMQLYFTFVLLHSLVRISPRWVPWILFNFSSACAVLLISGARSRIIIAGIVLGLAAVTFILKVYFPAKMKNVVALVGKTAPIFAVLTMGYLLIAISDRNLDWEDKAYQFPVIAFLRESLEKGDISLRLGEAGELSIIPDDVTLFGDGLGSVGQGKPGEFGIRSMWVESGLIWGFMLLLGFIGIVLILLSLSFKAFWAKNPTGVAIYCLPLLIMILALLAGLTSAFELSSGILLGCSIAVITRSTWKTHDFPPPVLMRGIDPIRMRRL
jgi:hypothetical protein